MRSSRGALQALDEAVLEGAQLAPGAHRIGLVEKQRALDEGLEVGEVHARLLGAGLRRPQRRAPALAHRLLAQRLARPRRAGEPLGIDPRQRARVLRRLDAELRVRLLGLRERDLREAGRDGGPARGGRTPPSRPAARRAAAATRRARGSRAGTRAAAARPASSSARGPPGRARPPGSSRPAGRRSGPRRARHGRAAAARLRAPALGERGQRLGGVGVQQRRRARATSRSCGSRRAPAPMTPIRHSLPASGPRPPEISIPCSSSSARRTAASSTPARRRHREQRVQLLAVGRQALAAEHAERVAQRVVRAAVALPRRRQPLLADGDPQRLAQRVDHVDRRGVVVGARPPPAVRVQ